MNIKRKPISKELRHKMYEKYNEHCAYCGCEITEKEMQIDHIQAYKKYGENLDEDNLMPSCRQCNFYKSTLSLEVFRKRLLDTLYANLKQTFQFRLAEKYGLIKDMHLDGIEFYFEREEKNK